MNRIGSRRTAALVVALSVVAGCAGQRNTRSASRAPTPADRRAAATLRSQADAAYSAKAYAQCGALLDEAARLDRFDRGLSSVNAACCHALAGDPQRAFASLDRALGDGYRSAADLESEGELATLHANSRWGDVLARARANAGAYLAGANGELVRMYEEDQADRRGDPAHIDWSVVGPRDEARRKRTAELVATGALATAADYFHAAMIYQHGHGADDFETAARLAKRAAELDPASGEARWLAAAATDRALMTRGKPQRYGTQLTRGDDGRWALYPVDPAVSDDERAAWNVPSLAEAQRQATRMNATAPAAK